MGTAVIDITGSTTATFTWDQQDRLTGVPSANVTYAYDADGRRVSQTVNSMETNYLWDEVSPYGDVVLETNASGAILANYVLGNTRLVAQSRGGTVSFYLADGQGSTRALANIFGTITDTYAYDAFGELYAQTGTTENPYRYTGQQFDDVTGLYSLRAREYDPAVGRFLSRDPASCNLIPSSSGCSSCAGANTCSSCAESIRCLTGKPSDNCVGVKSEELNRYIYVANSPINRFDPTGYMAAEYQGLLGETTTQDVIALPPLSHWIAITLMQVFGGVLIALPYTDKQIEEYNKRAIREYLEALCVTIDETTLLKQLV